MVLRDFSRFDFAFNIFPVIKVRALNFKEKEGMKRNMGQTFNGPAN